MMGQQRRENGSWELNDWSTNYLEEKWRLEARLARDTAAIGDLLYSSKNFISVWWHLQADNREPRRILQDFWRQKSSQMMKTILKTLTKGCSSSSIKFQIGWKILKMNMIRNQSHLEEVQRVDLQKNLQDHQDQAKLLSHESWNVYGM